jgi:hypothetical protein
MQYIYNCNGFGVKVKTKNGIYALHPDYSYYYLDHYYSKSTEEFINKINRGSISSNTIKHKMHRIYRYYIQSNLTKNKIEMIEKRTKLNLSYYKIILGYLKKKI